MKISLFTLDKLEILCYNNQAFGELLRQDDERRPENCWEKKLQKSFKNLLTNAEDCGIMNNTSAQKSRVEKFFKKLLKNPLTKRMGCGIIPRLCARERVRLKKLIIENWTTGDRSTSKSECENLEIPRIKNVPFHDGTHTLKSKKSQTSSTKDLNRKRLKYNLLESLILAQDERWRRA